MSPRPRRRLVVIGLALAGAGVLDAGVVSAQNPPETVEYYATDALGSVRIVFTPSGQVIGRSAYLPFGETRDQSGSLPRQRFTGQERDGEAGLDYFNARSLQMRTGRMNQPDPAFGGAMTNPQAWNRYAYVINNPLRYVDPSGAEPQDIPIHFYMSYDVTATAPPKTNSAQTSSGSGTSGGVDEVILALTLGRSAVGRAAGTLVRPHEGPSGYKKHHSADDLTLVAAMAATEKTEAYNPTPEEREALVSVVFNRAEESNSTVQELLTMPHQFQTMTATFVANVLSNGVSNAMAVNAANAVDAFGATTDATQFLVYRTVRSPSEEDLRALGQKPELGLFLQPASPPIVGTVWLFSPRRRRAQ
jgi:RHS repeat-associated protein